MDAWDVMKSRESDAIADVKKGGGMFPTEPDMSVVPKQGLQKKDVEVHRAGKTFKSTRWIRPGEAAKPEAKKPAEPPADEHYDKLAEKGEAAAQRYARKMVTLRRDKLLRDALAGKLEARTGHHYESGMDYQEASKTWKTVALYGNNNEGDPSKYNMHRFDFQSNTGRAYAYEGDPSRVINLHVHSNYSVELRYKEGMAPKAKPKPEPKPEPAKQPMAQAIVRSSEVKRNMEIANTIYKQLGGGRFKLMTGAKHFSAGDKCLMFGLPYNFAKDGINKIKISLTPMDTYKVEFWRIGRAPKFEQKLVSEHDDVYVDSLRELISDNTGLALKMPNIMMGHPAKGFEQETPPSQA